MKTAGSTGEGSVGETLAKVAMGVTAGAIAVWARDCADMLLSNLGTDETRAQTIAARPDGELPGERLVSMVEDATGRRLSKGDHAAAGEFVQYAMGIWPVIGYALIRDQLPMRGVARGAAFGATMFVGQDQLLNTVTGLNCKPGDYPWTAHVQGIVAQTVYGVVAELALDFLEGVGERLGRDGATSSPHEA